MAKRFFWLKLKEDYFDSPRIKKLRKIAGGDTYTVIYLKMQLLSIKNQGVIEYEGIEPTFCEELALKLNEEPENVEVTLSYLASQGLIEESGSGTYLLPEALKGIGSENESAERVRAFRNKKALQCNDDVTMGNVLESKSNPPETSCNTDIDKDREIEKKKKAGKPARARFTKPTLEEIQAYCRERGNGVDANRFVDYYEANGWKVGKNPMKDWKAAIRNWEKNGYSTTQKVQSSVTGSLDFEAMEAYLHGGGYHG
nr:MAG TPA: replisome organizer protein [Caudoviricetes sp.]